MKRLLAELTTSEPIEPRGWFRWMHDQYAGRYGAHADNVYDLAKQQGWPEAAKNTDAWDFNPDVWVAVVNRHAWTVGKLGLTALAMKYWEYLERESRGAYMAGLAEFQHFPVDMLYWIDAHISEADFAPEHLCGLACVAAMCNRADIVEKLLNTNTDLTAAVRRFHSSCSPRSEWDEGLKLLSNRVVDMILEAALIWENTAAVEIALKYGADPNISLWLIERSSNEKHCALSCALEVQNREIAELLLGNGALPSGTKYCGYNLPLFYALRNKWDDLAEQMIVKGATFSMPDDYECGASGMYFGVMKAEQQWAETTIGALLPLVPVVSKQAFYQGNGQGGGFSTFLDVVIKCPDRLKRFEALGLDTRLSVEELCKAIYWNAHEGLAYLFLKHGNQTCEKALTAIRDHKPTFGP
jgi:hypothetical protein